MAETRRASQQGTPLTILLMQFGQKAAMVKEFGETAVEAMMQQIGQLFAANIRQNDLAFRYETTTIAIVLGETPEKEASNGRRKTAATARADKTPGKAGVDRFWRRPCRSCGARRVRPVDIVTEVINRAEQALHTAVTQGTGKIVALAASYASAAVA